MMNDYVLMSIILFSIMRVLYRSIPLSRVYYISFYQYVFSALVKNHFSDITFQDCSAVSLVCYQHGEQYLEVMGMTRPLWMDLMAIGVFCVGLILIGFVSLKRVS